MSEQNWVRSEIIEALRQGYSGGDQQACVESQADAIMVRLETIAAEADTFHLFVGYLNNIRLDAARERRRDREGSDEAAMGELRSELIRGNEDA